MKKIIDIGGIYTNSFGDYEDENYLFGRILLDEKNNFEGIVENHFSNYRYLVFGSLKKDGLDFIIGNDETEEVPKRFITHKQDDCFGGSIYAKDRYNEIPLGECRISIRPAEQTREVTDYELFIINNQIEFQKISLGERSRELYSDFISQDNIKTGQKK